MSSNSIRCTRAGGAVVAPRVAASPSARAAAPADAAPAGAPVIVAQAPASPQASRPVAMRVEAYPAYQRGVREAAAEGPDALRRYIWRTRMIHNFYYYDFAPRQ